MACVNTLPTEPTASTPRWTRRASCRASIAILSLLAGCARRQQTGEALVIASTVAIVSGAQAASGNYCLVQPCYAILRPSDAQRSTGTAVALIGAGVAAAGYVLIASDQGDQQSWFPRSAADGGATAPRGWHMVRDPLAAPEDPEAPLTVQGYDAGTVEGASLARPPLAGSGSPGSRAKSRDAGGDDPPPRSGI